MDKTKGNNNMIVNIKKKSNNLFISINGKNICICSSKIVAEYIQELIIYDFDFNSEDYKITMLQKILASKTR